jgi:SSS family solute:Na+ symporter
LIIGAATLTFMGLNAVGGWGELKATVTPEYMNMWRPNSDPDFPWLPLVFTSSIVGIWYWCTDQVIVQRVLTARNLKEARRGTIFGAAMKITPIFLFLIPGIVALALKMKGEISFDSPDQAFPVLMTHLLPSGLRGLVAAGLMAALMSSLASVFNSCSTLFTLDIYKRLYPEKKEKALVNIGKIATGVVVILGILWIPVISVLSDGLYEYLQKVQAYLAPPIAAVFLLGIFWKRINSNGAIAALVVGMIIGMSKLMAETFMTSLTEGSILYNFAAFNWLAFGALFFFTCVLIALVVSLLTKAPAYEEIEGLTFGTLSMEDRAENKASYGIGDIVATVVIVLIIAWIMITFS